MKKLYLIITLWTLLGGIAIGQVTSAPIITNKPTTASPTESSKKNSFADLVGLKGEIAPQFALSTMDGIEYNLENLRGKIVVVNLWGTFCPPCVAEMPELNSLVKKYKNKEVVFLAPAPDDKKELEIFLKKFPFDYQILPNAMAMVEKYAPHRKSDDSQKAGGFMMLLPTHLVIDQTGTVTYHNWGFNRETSAELSKEIDSLLAKAK